jgi:hypothetical protein
MGYLLLAILSALAFVAGIAAAGRWAATLPAAERLVCAGVVALSIVLLPVQVLGYSGLLYPGSTAVAEGALALAVLGWAGPRRAWTALGGWWRAGRNALASPAAIVLTLASAVLLGYLVAYVILVPSWGWDALTYHDTIIGYAFQNHGLKWIDTFDGLATLVNGYPRNLELLGVWLGMFTPRDLLIDGGQLPLVLLAVVALAGRCRRVRVQPPVAWAVGLCFLWIPAVFLGAPSNYNDVGVGALVLCAVSLSTLADPAALPFAACAIGLLLGSKITGPIYAVIVAPPLAITFWRASRGLGSWKTSRRAGGLLALVLALGAGTYIRNGIHTGNPVWPAGNLPFGIHLPSPRTPAVDRPPFGGENDLTATWRSWTEPKPLWLVDTRSGGFGRGFLYFLLPLGLLGLGVLTVRALRSRAGWMLWPPLLLLASAWLNPYRWWARFTFGFPAVAILGAAVLLALLPRRWLREGATLCLGVAMVVCAWPARAGFFGPRLPASAWWDQMVLAWHRTPDQRATPVFEHWTPAQLSDRDQLIQPGEAAIYDDSVYFVYPLWRPDWKSRVLYLPLDRDPAAWLASLQSERVRWAQVRRGSMAERTLSRAGWSFAWSCPVDPCRVWVRRGPIEEALPGAKPVESLGAPSLPRAN